MNEFSDGLTFPEEVIPYKKLLKLVFPKLSKPAKNQHERLAFVIKSHNSWKEAQNLIIKKIIELEKEQELLRSEVNGKIKKLPKEKFYVYDVLSRHISRLKDFADAIVWQMYGLDKSKVRSRIVTKENYGFLKDKNLDSSLRFIEEVNNNPLNFALLSDITSVLGIGDVLVASNGRISLIELKEGKVNEQLGVIISDSSLSEDELREKVKAKYGANKGIIKQFDRMMRQANRAELSLQYDKDNTKRIDHIFNEQAHVIEFAHDDLSYLQTVEKLASRLDGRRPNSTVIDKSLFIAVHQGAYQMDVMFLMKHELYHNFWDSNCSANDPGEAQQKEFTTIAGIRLERLDIGFAFSGMTPVTLNLSKINMDIAAKILSGDIKVYTYLHIPSFLELAEGSGLKVDFIKAHSHERSDLANYKYQGKNIQFNSFSIFQNTNYLDICCGFVPPKDMLMKIKKSNAQFMKLLKEGKIKVD